MRAAVADFPAATFVRVTWRYAVAEHLLVVPTRGHSPGQLGAGVHDATAPDWVDELMDLDVDVALFAHDLAQWRPPAASFVGSRPGDPWPG